LQLGHHNEAYFGYQWPGNQKVAHAAGELLLASHPFAGYETGQVADIESIFKYPVPLSISG